MVFTPQDDTVVCVNAIYVLTHFIRSTDRGSLGKQNVNRPLFAGCYPYGVIAGSDPSMLTLRQALRRTGVHEPDRIITADESAHIAREVDGQKSTVASGNLLLCSRSWNSKSSTKLCGNQRAAIGTVWCRSL